MPCRIDVGDVWESRVNGAVEGTFTITKIETNGRFEGRFSNGGPQRIVGHCDSHAIRFARPANNPHFAYEGEFTSATMARGSRHEVFEDEDAASEAKREAPPPEDWEGEKVTE